MRVFAHVEVGQDLDRLTGSGQFVVARKRNENFVADAADFTIACVGRAAASLPARKVIIVSNG